MTHSALISVKRWQKQQEIRIEEAALVASFRFAMFVPNRRLSLLISLRITTNQHHRTTAPTQQLYRVSSEYWYSENGSVGPGPAKWRHACTVKDRLSYPEVLMVGTRLWLEHQGRFSFVHIWGTPSTLAKVLLTAAAFYPLVAAKRIKVLDYVAELFCFSLFCIDGSAGGEAPVPGVDAASLNSQRSSFSPSLLHSLIFFSDFAITF